MKNKKSLLWLILPLVLVVLLTHPEWLPLSATTKTAMQELISTQFGTLAGGVSLAKILVVILVVSIVWIVCTVLNVLIQSFKIKKSHGQTVASLVLSVIKYGGVLVGIMWGLSILGVDMTTILASLGIIGLVIGFGAQSLIEDIITGIFIIFEGQYDIGDVIVLGDFRGIVRNISVRTTTIEDVGGNLKIINNSDIRNLQNRSRNASLAYSIVSISYSTDIRKLEKLLETELPKMYEPNKNLYNSAPEYLGVQAVAESGIDLKFQVSCNEINIFKAQRQLNRDIKLLFDDNNVEIPFPQVVVHHGENKIKD